VQRQILQEYDALGETRKRKWPIHACFREYWKSETKQLLLKEPRLALITTDGYHPGSQAEAPTG
jgi:hypothetical protein